MGKIKSYLSKSMFERINGVDIEKLSTSELLRQVKLLPVLFILMIICAILILAFGILFAALMIDGGDFEDALIALYFLPFSFSSAFLAFIFPKRLKNVKKELDSREVNAEIQKLADKKLAETKKYSIIGLIAILAVTLIFGAVLMNGGFNYHANKKDVCKNCEREKKLVAGYDLCNDCFEGYLEWEDRQYE